MSSPKEPAQGERAIDLGKLVASVRRHPALHEFHCVFVNEREQVVATHRNLTRAIEAFFERLDTGPVAALGLRVYTVDQDGLALCWPDGRSPLERAHSLLASDTPVDLGSVSVAVFHQRFPGVNFAELHIRNRTYKMFEPWWPDPTEEREIIGRAIQGNLDPDTGISPWGLWIVHGTRETNPDAIEHRIARTINTLLPTEWKIGRESIRQYRTYQRERLPFDARSNLIELATRIAEQFGWLDPHGEEFN